MRIIFIILIFPLALFGQDNNLGTACDAAINAVLEISVNYLMHKNYVNLTENIEFKTKKDSIDWNNAQLIKWQITEPKYSLKIINHE